MFTLGWINKCAGAMLGESTTVVLRLPQILLCAVPSIGGGVPTTRLQSTKARQGTANLIWSPNNCIDGCSWSCMGVVKPYCGGNRAHQNNAMLQSLLRHMVGAKAIWHSVLRPLMPC